MLRRLLGRLGVYLMVLGDRIYQRGALLVREHATQAEVLAAVQREAAKLGIKVTLVDVTPAPNPQPPKNTQPVAKMRN